MQAAAANNLPLTAHTGRRYSWRGAGRPGAAMAMMKEYWRLLVVVTPAAMSSVGTHEAKP